MAITRLLNLLSSLKRGAGPEGLTLFVDCCVENMRFVVPSGHVAQSRSPASPCCCFCARGSITSVSASIPGLPDIPACMQTGPVQSSCAVGSSLNQNSSSAEADATAPAPGVLILKTFAMGSGTELHMIFGYATASAGFSYEIEAVGGTGQVLIAPGYEARASCADFPQHFSACSYSVTIGPGSGFSFGISGFPYLTTFSVPFPFTGRATAGFGLKPNYYESENEAVSLIFPVSSFLLLDPNTLLAVSGSVIVLADAPEPITALTVFCGVLGVFASRKRVSGLA